MWVLKKNSTADVNIQEMYLGKGVVTTWLSLASHEWKYTQLANCFPSILGLVFFVVNSTGITPKVLFLLSRLLLATANDPVFVFQNLRVEAQFPEEYFQVLESSRNGTYHIVKTLKKGFTDIEGQLRAVLREVGLTNVATRARLTVFMQCELVLNTSLIGTCLKSLYDTVGQKKHAADTWFCQTEILPGISVWQAINHIINSLEILHI